MKKADYCDYSFNMLLEMPVKNNNAVIRIDIAYYIKPTTAQNKESKKSRKFNIKNKK